MIKPTHNNRVFINCPFDIRYQPLLRAMIFTIYYCKYYPVTAMSEDNALDNRIDKILRIIESCNYGIHDISRTTLSAGWPRFNMPFELGLFYGARYFGDVSQKPKNALIFEKTKYSYQKFLSDLNGVDIRAHDNNPNNIIAHVRNWLNVNSGYRAIPGVKAITSHFVEFLKDLPRLSNEIGFPRIIDLPFLDYCNLIEEWFSQNNINKS